MSVTTSQRLNGDQLLAALPEGSTLTADGGLLQSTDAKTITVPGVSDQDLQTAISAAAAAFTDRPANAALLQARAVAALTANAAYLGHAAVPAGTLTLVQLSTIVRLLADQLDATTRQNTALIRILANQLDSTSGT